MIKTYEINHKALHKISYEKYLHSKIEEKPLEEEDQMLKVTTTTLFLVTLFLNSFFLGMGNGITILKFNQLCTCDHIQLLHTPDDHCTHPEDPHFCPIKKTDQKVENHFVIYPFLFEKVSHTFHLTYNVLFSVEPYSSPLFDSYPTKLLRPPKV